jgi:hypothetical protein
MCCGLLCKDEYNGSIPITDPLVLAILCGNYTALNYEIDDPRYPWEKMCRLYDYRVIDFQNEQYYSIYRPKDTHYRYKCTRTTLIKHLDTTRIRLGLRWDETIIKIQKIVSLMKDENYDHEMVYAFLRVKYTPENLYDLLHKDFAHVVYPLLKMCIKIEDMYYYNHLDHREYRHARYEPHDYYMNYYVYFKGVYEKNRKLMHCKPDELKAIKKILMKVIHVEDVVEKIIEHACIVYTDDNVTITEKYEEIAYNLEINRTTFSPHYSSKMKMYDEIENAYYTEQPCTRELHGSRRATIGGKHLDN